MAATLSERKSDRLVARVTPEDKALFERAAALEGCSVGTFVVLKTRSAAEKVVKQYEAIRLSQEESRRFMEALLAPPFPASLRFQKALRIHRETVTER